MDDGHSWWVFDRPVTRDWLFLAGLVLGVVVLVQTVWNRDAFGAGAFVFTVLAAIPSGVSLEHRRGERRQAVSGLTLTTTATELSPPGSDVLAEQLPTSHAVGQVTRTDFEPDVGSPRKHRLGRRVDAYDVELTRFGGHQL